MRKKLFTFLFALITSVGLSWADDQTPVTNPEIKLYAYISGNWVDTEAFTDNSNGTASWSISTLKAGKIYNFFLKSDGVKYADGGEFTRTNPSRVISPSSNPMSFQPDAEGEFTFTWEYATQTLTIGFPNPPKPNSITFNGSHKVGDNSISLTYYFNPANVPGFNNGYLPTLKVKHGGDKDEKELGVFGISAGTKTINLTNVGAFAVGETYEICFAYMANEVWHDEVFQTLTFSSNTVAMKGSWDEWADVVNFTDNGDGTASVTKTFEHEGYYTFKTVLDGNDWHGNGEAFKRNYTGAEGIDGNTDMTLWVDAKGEYTFTWTYASNRIDITYPALPTIYMNGEWDWEEKSPFTDNGDGTASYNIHFSLTGNYKAFKIRVGENDWRSNGQTFDPEHSSYAWINENNVSDMRISVDKEADYTFTWTYVENKLTISFPASGPTVAMKGSWDEWVDEVNFTDNGNGTASAALTFEHEGYYTFKTVLGSDDWRGNGEAFKRNYTGAEGIVGDTDMTLWVDAKGEYTFTWTYASNRIDITYPALPTVYLYLNGSADAFTDNGDGTALYYYHFSSTGSEKEFKIRVGEDWRSNGQTFDPEHTTYDWINDNGGGAYMKIKIDAEADYTFTWTYVENKLEITHPVVPDYTLTTKVDPENPGVYYSTFYSSNYSYKLMDDGTEAFIASISGGDLVLTQIAEGEQVIPKGTAVIFRKTGSSRPIGLRDTEENNTSFDPADNDLRGVDVATPIADKGMTQDNCYVLSGTAQYGVGFYKINDTMLKQHKAYVKYEGGPNNAPKKMRFVYGQATGIENTSAKVGESEKILENGQLFIIKNGVKYNAMGQMVK